MKSFKEIYSKSYKKSFDKKFNIPQVIEEAAKDRTDFEPNSITFYITSDNYVVCTYKPYEDTQIAGRTTEQTGATFFNAAKFPFNVNRVSTDQTYDYLAKGFADSPQKRREYIAELRRILSAENAKQHLYLSNFNFIDSVEDSIAEMVSTVPGITWSQIKEKTGTKSHGKPLSTHEFFELDENEKREYIKKFNVNVETFKMLDDSEVKAYVYNLKYKNNFKLLNGQIENLKERKMLKLLEEYEHYVKQRELGKEQKESYAEVADYDEKISSEQDKVTRMFNIPFVRIDETYSDFITRKSIASSDLRKDAITFGSINNIAYTKKNALKLNPDSQLSDFTTLYNKIPNLVVEIEKIRYLTGGSKDNDIATLRQLVDTYYYHPYSITQSQQVYEKRASGNYNVKDELESLGASDEYIKQVEGNIEYIVSGEQQKDIELNAAWLSVEKIYKKQYDILKKRVEDKKKRADKNKKVGAFKDDSRMGGISVTSDETLDELEGIWESIKNKRKQDKIEPSEARELIFEFMYDLDEEKREAMELSKEDTEDKNTLIASYKKAIADLNDWARVLVSTKRDYQFVEETYKDALKSKNFEAYNSINNYVESVRRLKNHVDSIKSNINYVKDQVQKQEFKENIDSALSEYNQSFNIARLRGHLLSINSQIFKNIYNFKINSLKEISNKEAVENIAKDKSLSIYDKIKKMDTIRESIEYEETLKELNIMSNDLRTIFSAYESIMNESLGGKTKKIIKECDEQDGVNVLVTDVKSDKQKKVEELENIVQTINQLDMENRKINRRLKRLIEGLNLAINKTQQEESYMPNVTIDLTEFVGLQKQLSEVANYIKTVNKAF